MADRGNPPSAELTAALDGVATAGIHVVSHETLPGDVSRRRYVRLHLEDGSAILALYPRDLAPACRRFAESTRLLAQAGVPVPSILAADCDSGWMMVEDAGSESLYDLADHPWPEISVHLETAAGYLPRIRELPVDEVAVLNPPLDRELLAMELEQTWNAWLEPAALTGHGDLPSRLRAAFADLCAALAADKPVPCHRDFMARNLLLSKPEGGVTVIDHQDLRLGPPAYDLASLLNDSLFAPPDVESRLVERWLPAGCDRESYERAVTQRALKAAGTFASFARRGDRRHVPLMPAALRRALEGLRRLPESSGIADELETAWEPALAGRPEALPPLC